MSTPNDGGPAFPTPVQDDRDCHGRVAGGYGGMSLRAYFAGQFAAAEVGTYLESDYSRYVENIAGRAVRQADALIAELSKKEVSK